MGKARYPQKIGGIRTANGNITNNSKDTISEIVQGLFPRDDPAHDTLINRVMRGKATNYGGNSNDYDFTIKETASVISSLANKKAPGLDNLSKELIKGTFNRYPHLFLKLFNKCLKLGFFPNQWRNAKLVLLLKPRKDYKEAKAYRPICLLTSMSKVLDKLITQRVFADSAAKEATQEDVESWSVNLPISNLQATLKNDIKWSWQGRWNSSTSGALLRQFFPKVSRKRLVKGLIAQLATGHGKFPPYFHRFQHISSGECFCKEGEGGTMHYLTECPLTLDLRNTLKFLNNLEQLFCDTNEKTI